VKRFFLPVEKENISGVDAVFPPSLFFIPFVFIPQFISKIKMIRGGGDTELHTSLKIK